MEIAINNLQLNNKYVSTIIYSKFIWGTRKEKFYCEIRMETIKQKIKKEIVKICVQ